MDPIAGTDGAGNIGLFPVLSFIRIASKDIGRFFHCFLLELAEAFPTIMDDRYLEDGECVDVDKGSPGLVIVPLLLSLVKLP